MSYKITTQKSWERTMSDLDFTFRKWGVSSWDANYPRGARSQAWNQSEEDRTVSLTYQKNGKTVNLSMGMQSRAVDNLRVLYIAIESMRMNERRGIGEVLESAYMQIAAPATQRNPYEVLGIFPGAPLEVAEAVYRVQAKTYHPDSPTGNAEKFKEITEALEQIKNKKI